MSDLFVANYFNDNNDKPAGGVTSGTGFIIAWQNGPLSVDGVRKQPTGAFVENVIAAALDRLEYYQRSEFACNENSNAIDSLKAAMAWLNQRTTDRQTRGVQGTHAI